jgi:Fe-Mn family superoxide dismutase
MKNIALSILLLICFVSNAQVPYELPKLNYNYDAFEPIIDSQTMKIHYKNHHKSYITNLNKALENANFKNETLENLFLRIDSLPIAVRNHGGGHWNHSFFWESLKKESNFDSKSNLYNQVISQFGSIDSLKKNIIEHGTKIFGSGWVWVIKKSNHQIEVCATSNQDNPLMANQKCKGTPLLGIDVWEHAYYLRYNSKRGEYLSNILKIIDWQKVNQRFNQ